MTLPISEQVVIVTGAGRVLANRPGWTRAGAQRGWSPLRGRSLMMPRESSWSRRCCSARRFARMLHGATTASRRAASAATP